MGGLVFDLINLQATMVVSALILELAAWLIFQTGKLMCENVSANTV